MTTTAARATQKAAPPGRVAAFFDFDGTLIDGYSAKAVLTERFRHGDLGLGEIAGLADAMVRTALGEDVVEDFMKTGVQGLRGKSVDELDAFGRRLARSVIGSWLFPEVVPLIAHHQRLGHVIVIASSALPFQVEPLARELGVDHVLCTRLAAEDGVCTGAIDGEVLWGAAKAAAVRELAATEGIDLAASHGYANGDEDIDFLSAVGHPVAVNPGPQLAQTAVERGWPVELFAGRRGPGVVDAVRTVAAYGGLAAATCLGAALGLLNRSRREAANVTLSVGADVGLSLAGVRLNVHGEENLWSHRPAVFIFNHQSMLDGWVAIKLLRSDVTGVGKKEMSRLPVLAQFAWVTNVALVDRADGAQARAALEPVLERLRDGYSITLAPEGTRSVTARVGPFKKGAFHLAMQAGVPIVPIVIRNAGELQWRGSNVMKSGEVDVAVLPPIPTTGWSRKKLDEHVTAVRGLFVDALEDWDAAVAGLRPPQSRRS